MPGTDYQEMDQVDLSSQGHESALILDSLLSPDELFGLAMADWRHIDEAHREAPTNMLREYKALLEKGSDPNLIVLGYRVASDSLSEGLWEEPPLLVHRLLSSDSAGRCLEWRRSHARTSSQHSGSAEIEELEAAEIVVGNSTSLAGNLYRIFHPLSDAACCLDHRRIAMLKAHGANFKEQLCDLSDVLSMLMKNPFLPAVRAQDEELVHVLIKLATPSHALTLVWTGLCLLDLVEGASLRSHAQLCIGGMLLQYGAVINGVRFLGDRAHSYMRFWLEYPIAIGDPNRSPLQIATGDTHTDNIQTLIHHGADVNARDVVGMSPLLEAVYYGHSEAVRILLSHGAKVDQRAGEQACTLDESVHQGKGQPARTFDYDRRLFDVAAYVRDRWPALHIAAQRGFSTVAKVLLMNGADIAAQEQTGRTALDIAVQSSNLDTAFELLCFTSSFEAHSDSGARLMGAAIENKNFSAMKILMDHRVPLRVREDMQEEIIDQIQNSHSIPATHIPNKPILSFWISEEGHLINPTELCWHCLPRLPAVGGVSSSLGELHQIEWCRFCQLVDDCNSNHIREDTLVSWEYKDIPTSGCQLLLRIDGNPFTHDVKRTTDLTALDEWHKIFQSLDRLEDQNTGSPAAILLAKHWIEKCINTHAQCNSPSMKGYFPTRVISVLGTSLKLVCNPAINAPYVALSHRWGSESLPRTLSTNYQSRMEGLWLDELTQTMQDAVILTRRLGYQYIWIDALCIIQDSEEDWLNEAAKMSEVFSGAIVTIAVADAEDHSEGIIRPRMVKCTKPFAVPFLETTPYHQRVEHDGEGQFYVFPNTPIFGAGPRQKGTLDTRGWILQGQMLSRRILYFEKGEIFWDCNTVSASESSPVSISLLQDESPDETWALRTIRRTLSQATDVNLLEQKLAGVWIQLIKNYSSRHLTHQRDRLVALQGILRPLSRLLHQEPVAGMWRTQLWRQLLWWISNQPPKKSSASQLPFPAPSWSWLCASGPVAYHNSLATQQRKQGSNDRAVTSNDFTDLESRITIKSIDAKTLPDGRGVAGSLTISGLSFRYHLTTNDLKKSGVKRFNASKWKLNIGNWLLDGQFELPLDLHCIVVAEDSVAKMLVCLCVVRNEQSDEWRRIGLCHWDGLTWQISKHTGKAPEERTFTII